MPAQAPIQSARRYKHRYRIAILCERPDGQSKQVEVDAWDSATPGLAITQAIVNADKVLTDRWHVTHLWTTKMIDKTNHGMEYETARLIAGALGGLPINWNARTYQEIQRQWTTNMPPDLKNWVRKLD